MLRTLTRISCTAFTLAAFGFHSAGAYADAVVGEAAPAFSAPTADGKTLSLDGLKGKTVVLEWTNDGCPFVKKHYESGNIPRLQKEAAAKGAVWLQVISSAPGKQGYADGPAAQKLNSERGAKPANILLDPEGKIARAYGAQTTPHIFIIDGKGVLTYKGGVDSIPTADKADLAKAEDYVTPALTATLAGQKVATATTRPYGCSIKYAN